MYFNFEQNKLFDILNNRPHLIEQFFYCKRQFLFHLINFYNQDNHLLEMGRVLHDKKTKDKRFPIKVDIIDWKNKKIIELKKGNIGIGAELQAYHYLKLLSEYNQSINCALVRSIEKKQEVIIKYPDQKYENLFRDMVNDVISMHSLPKRKTLKKYCKNCSFFDYCWV